ncbi:MAG: hypothetical protein ACI8T1_001120 [Verrucomicrobiales bacterium]|jgi:hypothetical protein
MDGLNGADYNLAEIKAKIALEKQSNAYSALANQILSQR